MPGGALQVPTPPDLGVLSSIISLISIYQLLGHPEIAFFRVQTDGISVYPPPPPQRCQKWVFSPREPGTAIQVPIPPNLGVLSSIDSLMLINQALGHPKMRFWESRPTEFPFIHTTPSNGAENRFFHLVSPAGHFRYPPTPILWVLNSIISLILINQALGNPKMRFQGPD